LELPYNGRVVRLTHFIREGVVNNGDDGGGGGGVGSDNVYRGRVESVLVLLSNLYSEEKILVCDSRSSSCSIYISY